MSEHLAQLRIAGDAIAGAAARGGLDRDIPSCPGWTLADLLRHVGAVHRWAVAVVDGRLTGRSREMFALQSEHLRLAGAIPAQALPEWFAQSHAGVLRALAEAPPDVELWTFLPHDGTAAEFWARRQAHETAMHAIDAQLAVVGAAAIAPLPAWFAADGIDELLTGFARGPAAKARSAPPTTMLIAPRDDPARWLITIGPDVISTTRPADEPEADAVLRGTAHDLYSMLWNRPPIGDVDIDGDPTVPALWRDGVTIT